jgi:adenine deaminase
MNAGRPYERRSEMELPEIIDAAAGRTPCDLLLKNCRVVNVLTGEIVSSDVAVHRGLIVAMETVPAVRTIDLDGRFVTPGFIDAHVHIESSMVTVPQYARAVLPQGTTAVVADPHEIANVLGKEGVRAMLESAAAGPLDVFVMAPSCVPATAMETSGAELSADDIASFYGHPSVLGLAEMMNFPGVLFKDPVVLEKIRGAKNGRVDGHAPGLTGTDLSAYIAAGIRSDHECTTPDEAREKIRKGMCVFIREGTAAKNLEALLPLVGPGNADCFAFCTDDRHPFDLLRQGHMNYLIRRSIELGLDPVLAVRLATRNPALHFGLRDRGAVAPGLLADLAIVDDLKAMTIHSVIKNGRVAAENGTLISGFAPSAGIQAAPTIRVKPFGIERLGINAEERKKLRVMRMIPGQIVTRAEWVEPKIRDGKVVCDLESDVLKIAVLERHRGTGNIGLGMVAGFGLKNGALGSSVAHDSHNLIIVGTNDADMMAAAESLIRMQGGLVAVRSGKVLCELALPVAGLMTSEPLEAVSERLEALKKAARSMGCPVVVADPFMQLSFLALPVIPELKLTDKGLFDVVGFKPVPLFGEG